MQTAPVARTCLTDFRFDSDDNLSDLGGASSRFKLNVAAIRLLKNLKEEPCEANTLTLEEQRILARYTGWGDSDVLNRAFPNGAHSWARPCAELAELLTPDEIKGLLASSLNAHFTALPIIRAIYAALDHFGLSPRTGDRVLELDSGQSVSLSSSRQNRLRILEPAAGVGHFLGAMPQALKANSERVVVEIDSLTARILTQLYPQTKVFIQPFEETPLPENYFDLVVSNVPFGNYAVADAGIRESFLKASIHDYFFAKSLRLLKPGGIIAFITSRYTLDKKSPKVRQYLASHAELLATARLPRNAFRANAGTEVVTDVLIFRKRNQPLKEAQVDWAEVGNVTLSNEARDEREFSINNLYIAHPERMLGNPTYGRGMYEAEEFLLKDDGRNLAESLAQTLITQLPTNGYRAFIESATADEIGIVSDRDDFLTAANINQLPERDQVCVNQLLEIYVAAKEVIRLQLRDASDDELKAKQQELSDLYSGFKMRFGSINGNIELIQKFKTLDLIAFRGPLLLPFNPDFNSLPVSQKFP